MAATTIIDVVDSIDKAKSELHTTSMNHDNDTWHQSKLGSEFRGHVLTPPHQAPVSC